MVMTFVAASIWAQQDASSYIVKTKGVKKTEVKTEKKSIAVAAEEDEENLDFVSRNFRFYSLCDWKDGMKFMVIPEKYDLLVNTFRDETTGKEVSSGGLRYKIMIYNSHSVGANNRERMNFTCQDDGKKYYFELPHGSFDDYCYGKLGVPTLAYLGDVDIAREKLLGQTLVTRTSDFRVDTEYEGDGFQEVTMPKNEEVKVVAVGVGTRAFPVKIIVADKTGKEFYQIVAMSKTNSGMRDDEFGVDNLKHTFLGAFEALTENTKVSDDYAQYLGKVVYTKYATSMLSKGSGKNRIVNVPRLMEFRIDKLAPVRNSDYVTLTLAETGSGRIYYKDVTFTNKSVTGDIDGQKEDYFGYLFGFGEGKLRNTSSATRAMIRQGRVGIGMTEEEVEMAVGTPDKTAEDVNGRYDWLYERTKSWLIVQFGKNGTVIGTRTTRK